MRCAMDDLIYTLISAGLFAVACLYARACAHI